MLGTAEIDWVDVVHEGSTVRATATLRLDGGGQHSTTFVVHAVPGEDDAPSPPSHRVALLALLPVALRLGTNVHVNGPIDDVTLAGVREWQHALARWVPERFTPVTITAEAVLEDEPPPRFSGGVTAFSGGLDSAFALLRPAADGEARENDLVAGMMVHGFDLPLDQPETFALARARAEAMVSSAGAHLRVVESDLFRLLDEVDLRFGEEVHGIWLASALACVELDYDHTVIPSSYPYHRPKIPWGSGPTTDNLLGSRHRPLRHDGAGFDKFDKTSIVARVDAVQKHIRVCWEGPEKHRNCGHCWKCMVTQVAFWLNGVPDPPAFDEPCTVEDLRRLSVDGYRGALAEHFIEVASGIGLTDIVEALREALRQGRAEERLVRQVSDLADGAAFAWLQLFARLVREKNFEAARHLFHPDCRSFGTLAAEVTDREQLVEQQWRPAWTSTRGFSVDPGSVHVESGGDLRIVTARWSSLGSSDDGTDFARHGRCTFVLRQVDETLSAVHSHFSLDPT